MEIEIYDKEKYRQELIAYYGGILDGRFIKLNPQSMSDEELLESIPIGPATGTDIFDINNSCCWLYIGKSVRDNYNGNDYTYVNFCSDKESRNIVLSQNYSQFRYPMSLRTEGVIPQYYENGETLQSTIDDNIIEPEDFFTHGRVGEKILYLGYLPGVTKYGKEKNCVDFAYRKVSPIQIRGYIRTYQRHYLTMLENTPTLNIPYTTSVVKINGEIARYCHNSKGVETIEFAKSVYQELFSNRVKSMLREIQNKLS